MDKTLSGKIFKEFLLSSTTGIHLVYPYVNLKFQITRAKNFWSA